MRDEREKKFPPDRKRRSCMHGGSLPQVVYSYAVALFDIDEKLGDYNDADD